MSDKENNIPKENDPNFIPSDDNIESIDPIEETNAENVESDNENTDKKLNTQAGESTSAESEATEDATEKATEETTNETTEEVNASSESANEQYAFEWKYENIQDTPPKAKPRRRRTGLIFGIATSGIFVLAIIALIVSVLLGVAKGSFDFNASSKPTVDLNTQINVSDKNENTQDSQDATSESIEKFKHSTVVVLGDTGTGTGIILDDNGMIVTNHHVIENCTTISVYLYDGRSFNATLIGSDAYNDIAVIKINAPNLSPATFVNSDNTYTGQRVYAVGTPAGPEFAWSVTAGIVSCPSRELKFYNDNNQLERSLNLIQTDALVNPGNSGGPLINTNCEVMGIVTMRLSDTYVGMGFAIPTNVALPIIQNIITNYKAPSSLPTPASPQLGISGIVVAKGERFMMSSMGFKDIVTEDYFNRNPDSCKYATHAGIYVLGTTEGFDAAGKLLEGDIIIQAENVTITSMNDLKSVITSKRIGDTMSLIVVRNNSQIKIDVTLGKAVQ